MVGGKEIEGLTFSTKWNADQGKCSVFASTTNSTADSLHLFNFPLRIVNVGLTQTRHSISNVYLIGIIHKLFNSC